MKKKHSLIVIVLATLIGCNGNKDVELLPIIDMHLHVYTDAGYWGGEPAVLKDTTLESPRTRQGHLDSVLEEIKRHNIVMSFASGNMEALRVTMQDYPDLFFPSVEIWPRVSNLSNPAYLDQLRERIINGSVKGIGEVTNAYYGIDANDPFMDTIYKLATEYDLPIAIHIGGAPSGIQLTSYPRLRMECSNPLLLQDVLINHPGLRLNIMHAGLPLYIEETLFILYMFPHVYADIGVAAWYDDYAKETLRDFLIKAIKYGVGDRIMFGSDEMVWPGAIGLSVKYIKNADFLTADQKRDILYNNAAKFLRLSDEEKQRHFAK